jgi:arsenate reductase (thioredoxin)
MSAQKNVPKNVLILCTGNSARSIMAEAILNSLGQGRFVAYSAGSRPAGKVNPAALRQLQSAGHAIAGLRSKSWDEFAATKAPRMDIVITVCDSAAKESCPLWPGAPVTAHWGMPDPAAVKGPDAEIRKAFEDAYRVLQHKMKLLVDLPVARLDRGDLQKNLREISGAHS